MPQQLSKEHKTLQMFGVYSKIVYNASTDYFMGIRFTNKIEKEERRNFNLMPSEDNNESLKEFLEDNMDVLAQELNK